MLPRNVVLVTVDSLRADHCGFHGYEKETTPTLDWLAENGVSFENAVAPGPRTPSSAPVFQTGRFVRPPDEWTWQSRWQRIRDHLRQHATIADRFRQRGYTTVSASTNPWTHGTGFDRGFDHFVELTADDMQSPPTAFTLLDRAMDIGDLGDRYNWQNKREWFVQWQTQYEHILETLERARSEEPYFLWLFLLDTHQPYITPREHRHESSALGMYYAAYQENRRGDGQLSESEEARLRRAYRDAIRSTDAFVEQFLGELADDNPAFVFHSDHGEAFGEHGTYGHESRLYEENLQVPLFVHGLDRAECVSEPFSLRRLPDLLCALADDELGDPSRFTDPFVAAATEDDSQWALRGDRWKYIRGEDEERLYDLRHDPEERADLTASSPEVTQALRSVLKQVQSDPRERAAIDRALDDFDQYVPGPEITT